MQPGDRVRVDRGDVTNEGVLLPSTTHDHLVVKLDGGYNVGIDRDEADVEVLESGARDVDEGADAGGGEASEITFDGDLPTISLISTGGTIASTVDYRTGAVTAQFDAEDVLRAVPDLAGRANYRGRVVANILSENMEPPIWQELAEAVREEIAAGADGVVVMHGTDTMQYSASALSFMLDSPVPIVFTGSQRSADRPSSDNVMNAVCAVEAAKADHAETLVCMHASQSDDACALHRGTRVRKNHTSRRDAFETVGGAPLGRIDYEAAAEAGADGDAADAAIEWTRDPLPRGEDAGEDGASVDLEPDLDGDVELVKFTPGMDPAAWDYLDSKDGVVIEGTGLGHVHTDLIPRIEALIENGTVVAMTSQCLAGRVCDRVYDTGRDLLDAGVVEAGDTLPGTAKVKLMWALANLSDPAEAMGRDLAGELTEESQPWR
ncbi:Glu-tRNA(Gln) amidotransferase subunit GatD [Halorubrum lacusprofundi]|jgi:glutamyl-tRNA(Gln) amidotransferase subunit D|uniref:Glutamyl-tRNA(Gln) amidotransferase subunit D n=1 Tax=Halorubrum lacusprofundi (strain ATCC 49239 / DSM 5036 / JCM 8891 / ACAM 34) TaxID=416348 RepID=B9LR63_HALLT|nr:Glu-tRNA(Gln) amidotransferase subunit GatD [Halorubrum lacusprofundi]ACM57717.1 glutamyl-tRNA(Gln) amidotransferase, subunit D [Halorubrum lacusprofundi ATCC 49239]MCG1005686.1 Glu-tRNA(Gln) amidotransferase subunit GatD [Halorubrum lacusprofundi]